MSTYYDYYLEARVGGKWICISPMHKYVRKDDDDEGEQNLQYKFAAIYSGTASMGGFINQYGCGMNILEISEELQKQLFPKELINKLKEDPKYSPESFSNDSFYMHCCYEWSEYDLQEVEEIAGKKYDYAGFMTKEDAERIKSGDVREEDYPIDPEELPKDLPEYLFNQLYEYVEILEPYGEIQRARTFMASINKAIHDFNELNYLWGSDAVTLKDCRLICRIS